MPLFKITCKKPSTDKAVEQIYEEFDLLRATEITEFSWLLPGDEMSLKKGFDRIRTLLRHDGLVIREVYKEDINDRGKLSESDFEQLKVAARDKPLK